jgi:catechol 2,3-dioxygenase-like lactoylglutathione lyase family enzyme
VTELWLPFRVDDLDSAVDFYTVHLGLSQVDGWGRDGERGAVLRAHGGAYVELVSAPGVPAGAEPVAFRFADDEAVDRVFAALPADAPPARFPRGHYGFTLAGPAGARLMVWSER